MAAERISSVEARIMNVETLVGSLDAKLKTLQENTIGLGDGLTQVTADLKVYATGLAAEKVDFTQQLNIELDKHKLALASVVDGARSEFTVLKGQLTDLHGHTAQAFGNVKAKVEQLEAEILQRGTPGKSHMGSTATQGYLPMKSMVPSVFGNSEEQWRGWQDDVADYVDSQRRGMKVVLKAAEQEMGPIDEQWMLEQGHKHQVNAEAEKANLYRALKALTTGEAKTVVQGVRGENGYAAWKALHQRFGPSVAARQGKVMCVRLGSDGRQACEKPSGNADARDRVGAPHPYR